MAIAANERVRIGALACLCLSACADLAPEAVSLREQAVVYGADDRRELYQLSPDAGLRSLARGVAAVIPREALSEGPNGEPILLGQTLAQTFGLCSDQPFAQEISAAVCTAFLVDDALLATAGHCFNFALDCKNYLFVFDFVRDSRRAPVWLSAENIFECTRTRVRVDEMEPGVWKRDYALVELTRRVVGREPLPIRGEPIVLGEPVSVISASAGLPFKFDSGAHVLDARAHMNDFFRLDSDTGHGSSGAPVIDDQGQAVGIVVRGRMDYLRDDRRGCYVENLLPMPDYVPPGERVKLPGGNELYSEEANPIAPALSALCELSYPSPRLCGNQAVCGDLICSGEETFETCASDCTEAPAPGPPRPVVIEEEAEEDAGIELPQPPVRVPEHAHAHAHGGCALTGSGGGHVERWLLTLAFACLLCARLSRAAAAEGSSLTVNARDDLARRATRAGALTGRHGAGCTFAKLASSARQRTV